jgi:hypothetical protein
LEITKILLIFAVLKQKRKKDMTDTITTYKGITLQKNTTYGNLAGEGKYAVYAGGKKFPFNSVKAFKDAVNGKSDYSPSTPVSIPYRDENDNWGAVPLAEFKNFVLGAK